eukprot:7147976-Lingulodinium_polyedra.AAC.1
MLRRGWAAALACRFWPALDGPCRPASDRALAVAGGPRLPRQWRRPAPSRPWRQAPWALPSEPAPH